MCIRDSFSDSVTVSNPGPWQDDVVPAVYAMAIDSLSARSMRCCLRELYKQSPLYLSATATKSKLTREGRWY
eukprot:11489019-Alexandrium_andersonii.AAC.1